MSLGGVIDGLRTLFCIHVLVIYHEVLSATPQK